MTKKKQFDGEQKRKLLSHAKAAIVAFKDGAVRAGDPNPHEWGDNGVTFFEGFTVRYTDDFLAARRDFTTLAAKMLKAKSAHERTIRALCQKSGQSYLKSLADGQDETSDALEKAAIDLVDTVLAEAGREYTHIEPNFLVRHVTPDIIDLGRVRSMRTELAEANTPLSRHSRFRLTVGDGLQQSFNSDGTATLAMPQSVWVVEVPATKENVAEEAKWLIDVAVSLLRLRGKYWEGYIGDYGDVEAHPTLPMILRLPHVTMEGDVAHTGGGKLPGSYEVTEKVAEELKSTKVQSLAKMLFDPKDKSLAQRVAQGLGWMTRGRQVSDRAERLLSFFTALEALLTSSDKDAPVTQTISRHAAVILTREVKSRVSAYNQIKGLYTIRSAVVHAGRRDVLWQDVNTLQHIVETVYWIVLERCDLGMTQERFGQSLADGSHGLPWEFAPSPNQTSPTSAEDGHDSAVDSAPQTPG